MEEIKKINGMDVGLSGGLIMCEGCAKEIPKGNSYVLINRYHLFHVGCAFTICQKELEAEGLKVKPC